MNKIVKSISLTMLIIAVVFMTACTGNEEDKLDNRVEAYWDAKIKNDFSTAYTFLTPGWKTTESQKGYQGRMSVGNVTWTSVEMKSKECKQVDFCKVKIIINYKYRFPGKGGKIETDAEIEENWILKNNTWYVLPKKRK